jgi:hypothetical protein
LERRYHAPPDLSTRTYGGRVRCWAVIGQSIFDPAALERGDIVHLIFAAGVFAAHRRRCELRGPPDYSPPPSDRRRRTETSCGGCSSQPKHWSLKSWPRPPFLLVFCPISYTPCHLVLEGLSSFVATPVHSRRRHCAPLLPPFLHHVQPYIRRSSACHLPTYNT